MIKSVSDLNITYSSTYDVRRMSYAYLNERKSDIIYYENIYLIIYT